MRKSLGSSARGEIWRGDACACATEAAALGPLSEAALMRSILGALAERRAVCPPKGVPIPLLLHMLLAHGVLRTLAARRMVEALEAVQAASAVQWRVRHTRRTALDGRHVRSDCQSVSSPSLLVS